MEAATIGKRAVNLGVLSVTVAGFMVRHVSTKQPPELTFIP